MRSFVLPCLRTKAAWLWIWLSTLTVLLGRQFNELLRIESYRYHSFQLEDAVASSMISPVSSATRGDDVFISNASYPEMYGDVEVMQTRHPSLNLKTPLNIKCETKDTMALTCRNQSITGHPTVVVVNYRSSLVGRYDSNGINMTCSNGLSNVTIPNNVPSFIIIGVQKGGTTALFNYFKIFPNVQPSEVFEPHFFSRPRLFERIQRSTAQSNTSQERMCLMRAEYLSRSFKLSDYYRKAAEIYPSTLFTFEKTPAYIRVPGTALRIHSTYPDIKLIAILRDPVSRSYSQYAMDFERGSNVGNSFDEYVQRSIESLRKANLTLAPTVYEYLMEEAGSHDVADDQNFLLPPMSLLKTMEIVNKAATFSFNPNFKEKRMHTNILYAGMYALHLSEWLHYFELGKSLMVVQYEKLIADKSGVFGEILDFLGIPPVDLQPKHLSRDYSPFKLQNSAGSAVDPLPNRTRKYLQQLYRPYNQKLVELLGEEWLDAWGY